MKVLLTLVVCLVLVAAGVATAVPVQWEVSAGGNGHYYEAIAAPVGGISWYDASAQAQGRSYLGVHGHLASITSAAETGFLVNNLGGLSNWWLGGYQDASAPDYSEPGGGWRWVTGEPWSYTNWASGEPNNYSGPEYIFGASEAHLVLWSSAAEWNDLNADNVVQQWGYLVEYPVPEPSGLLALMSGVGMLVAVIRRRR